MRIIEGSRVSKIINPINKKRFKSKKPQIEKKKDIKWLGEYKDNINFQMKVVTTTFLENVAREILDCARNNNDCLTVEDLYLPLGIPPRTYYEWTERFPEFKEIHQTAVLILGSKREKGGLKRKLDSGLVNSSMHQYNQRWRESIEWRHSLREKEKGNSASNITVIMGDLDEGCEKPTPEQVAAKVRKRENITTKYER